MWRGCGAPMRCPAAPAEPQHVSALRRAHGEGDDRMTPPWPGGLPNLTLWCDRRVTGRHPEEEQRKPAVGIPRAFQRFRRHVQPGRPVALREPARAEHGWGSVRVPSRPTARSPRTARALTLEAPHRRSDRRDSARRSAVCVRTGSYARPGRGQRARMRATTPAMDWRSAVTCTTLTGRRRGDVRLQLRNRPNPPVLPSEDAR